MNAPAARGMLLHGQVMHRRLRPVGHRFVYPVFACLLPVHAIDAAGNAMLRINRPGLMSFRFADHGARDGSHPLPWIRGLLAGAGLPAPHAVWLQAFPRVLGYVFNPVSFWYCHDERGRLYAVLAEVNNTFGEHHRYLVAHPDARPIAAGDVLVCDKALHVSPFFPVRGHYRFRFVQNSQHAQHGQPMPPGGRLAVRIDYADAEGDLLHTSIAGRLAPLTARTLAGAFFRYPWLTLGVTLRIHWQAAKLYFVRRVPFFRKPEPPAAALTR